jgi:hypothetical protein
MRRHIVQDLVTGRIELRELWPGEGSSTHELLLAATHDCPECQAARARGEEPVIVELEDLLEVDERPPPS